ncbi:MAG: gamma-glutamyltransferase family protein [Spirochaetales bacterium]
MQFDISANYAYTGRRSVVLSPRAAVASSQPLATQAGLEVLSAGGTAADAAIAVAASLQVTQPCSTGLGGDAFCLYYHAASRRVYAYNGSGRSPAALTLEEARRVAEAGADPRTKAAAGGATSAGSNAAARGPNPSAASHTDPLALPNFHAHTVTVPGAADAWLATHGRFGALPLGKVLEPAITFARGGFSVEPMTARWWHTGAEKQLAGRRYGSELMISGRGPRVGERFANPGLAMVFEALAAEGAEVFYRGRIAERIAEEVQHEGGLLTLEDLAAHRGEWVEPISVAYAGHRVWECPPNGQGLAALLALETYAAVRDLGHSEADRVHAQVEAMRLAFADAAAHVADPAIAPAPLDRLLGESYAASRAATIDLHRRQASVGPGIPSTMVGTDTVYFSVVDEQGNGCSFINSNFMGFGTGIVPRGCGFTLQNRGRGFVLEAGHPNVLAGAKRPYHTIIPGLITGDSGELAAVFGVMGGMMQPQGHLQVVSAMLDRRVDPQSALDDPRWQIHEGDPAAPLLLEEGFADELGADLEKRGHETRVVAGRERATFGLGQIVALGADDLRWSGSDPRGDGHAGGF